MLLFDILLIKFAGVILLVLNVVYDVPSSFNANNLDNDESPENVVNVPPIYNIDVGLSYIRALTPPLLPPFTLVLNVESGVQVDVETLTISDAIAEPFHVLKSPPMYA
jgi:hypothetical protein